MRVISFDLHWRFCLYSFVFETYYASGMMLEMEMVANYLMLLV